MIWQPPTIISVKTPKNLNKFARLKKESTVVDEIERAVEELYLIDNPDSVDNFSKQAYKKYRKQILGDGEDKYGVWVHFSWSNTLVHFPPKNDLRKLRTSRNRNLVTESEQKKLFNKTVLIFGLSVGSNVVESLLLGGIGGSYGLVDLDELGPTNLNRIRAGFGDVGTHKVDLMARRISETDPFITQYHFKKGVSEKNLKQILNKTKPDIIIDEMDNLKLKIILRLEAKKRNLPLVMATDNGEDIILDIERYDKNKNLKPLHGILPEKIIQSVLSDKKMNRQQMGMIIGKYFVGVEHVPARMLKSLTEIGKTIPTWPQLGSAATLAGISVAYATKRILLGQPIKPGRYHFGPGRTLNPELKKRRR